MLRMIMTALLLAGCATEPVTEAAKQRSREEVYQDRQEQRAQQLRDEFNRLTGDAN